MERGEAPERGEGREEAGNVSTYPPQTAYPNGATMCTSACYVLACTFVGGMGMRLPPTRPQLHAIMTLASEVHGKLLEAGEGQHRLFSAYHVLRAVRPPEGLATAEVTGTVDPLPEGFPVSFEGDDGATSMVADLRTFLSSGQPGTAMLVTALHHTTAVLRDRAGAYWLFDPGVASVAAFPSFDALYGQVQASLARRSSPEFTGLLVREGAAGR